MNEGLTQAPDGGAAVARESLGWSMPAGGNGSAFARRIAAVRSAATSPDAAAMLFFAVATIVFTYPAVANLSTRAIGAYPGDNFHFLWELWFIADAIFRAHVSPFFDPAIYYPFGFSLIRQMDLSPATALLFSPLTWAIGEVASYNVLILLSFFLTAAGTYFLAKELWGTRPGALLAGIVTAFCAYRFTHAGGHLSIVSTQWIPFFFLFLERTIKRQRIVDGVLAGVFFGLASLVTWYYAFMTPIAAIFYVAVRVEWLGDRETLKRLVVSGATAVVTALVLVIPFVIPYAKATSTGAMTGREWEEKQAFSASVADYFIPSVSHPVWGQWMLTHWRKGANGQWLSEWELYIGCVAVLLALAAILLSRRDRRLVALLALAGGSFLLSLGPSLYFTHPAAGGAANLAPLSSIPMPVALLGRMPPFTFLRAWSRMGFFLQLAIALLAAGGLGEILKRIETRFGARSLRLQWAITAVAIALASAETLAAPLGMAIVQPRPVENWIAAQPGDFSVMEYPIPNHAYSGPAMYSRRLMGKPIVMGYASYPPNQWAWETLSLFPSDLTLDLLSKWRVKYVLVDESLYQPESEFWGFVENWASLEPAIAASTRLREVKVLDRVHVYALTDGSAPTGPELIPNAGFETAEAAPASWSPIGSPVYLRGSSAHSGAGAIRVDPKAFYVSGPIAVQPGQCYRLSAFERTDRPDSALRLQMNWVDASGRELDPSTASIETATASPAWTAAASTFRAPANAHAGRVYAVAHAGQVWVDDYSLRTDATGCASSLMAIPNPIPFTTTKGRVAVMWNTGDGTTGHLFAKDGGQEKLEGDGPYGVQYLDALPAGTTREFVLYGGEDRTTPLKTLVVSAAGKNGRLSATPNPVPVQGAAGNVTISWNSAEAEVGQIYVSENGSPEALFAEGPSGSQTASWIGAGRTYTFRLYAGRDRKRLLQSTTVTAAHK